MFFGRHFIMECLPFFCHLILKIALTGKWSEM